MERIFGERSKWCQINTKVKVYKTPEEVLLKMLKNVTLLMRNQALERNISSKNDPFFLL